MALEEIRGASTFEDVERAIRRFTEPLAKAARGRPRARLPSPGAASRLSQLYRADPAKAAREILDGPPQTCPIPLEKLHSHFQGVFARKDPGAPRPEKLPRLPRVEQPGVLEKEFTPEEVSAKLQRTKDPAPGQDGISYSLLKERDRKGKDLAAIFEGCRKFKSTPSAWKRAETILLFKDGDPSDPSNWRPISLCNTLYRLYAGCIAARITQWADAGKALSSQQKGFKGWEGHAEHRFLLQSVLHEAQSSGRECAVALLDLADAFGSISRERIFETLAEFGMPEGVLGLLRELYDGCTTAIKVRQKKTVEIRLQAGLKQGCPLSNIMFFLAIEPLLRFLDTSPGFSLYGKKVSLLAYADDLVLVAENAPQLQDMLDKATAAADWMGLRFSAKKCKTLHFKDGARDGVQDSKFLIQRKEMSCLDQGEPFHYLGKPIGLQSPVKDIISDLKDKVRKIKTSLLTPGQKADMIRRTLWPRFMSAVIELAVPQKDFFTLRSVCMGALSARAPYDQRGPRGLTMKQLSNVEVLTHAFLLLTSPDELVKAVAQGALRDTVEKSISKEPSVEDLASYLNGLRKKEFDGSRRGSFSLWAKARYATLQLRQAAAGLADLQWLPGEDGPQVMVSERLIGPSKRKKLASALKRALSMEDLWDMGVHPRF